MCNKRQTSSIVTFLVLLTLLWSPLAKASESVTASKTTYGSTTQASFTISIAQEIKWGVTYQGSAQEGDDFYLHTDPNGNLREILLSNDVRNNSSGTHYLSPNTYYISINTYNMGPGSYTIIFNRTASITVSPTSHDFENVFEGETSNSFTFTIKSAGDGNDFPVMINSVTSSDITHFEVISAPIGQEVPPNRSFQVKFHAGSTPGDHAANIIVSGTSSASVSPFTVTVRGTTVRRVGELDVASSFDLGVADWYFGGYVEKDLTINNIGNAPMTVNVSMVNNSSGVFSLPAGGNVGPINGGNHSLVTVRGTPTAESDFTGQINVFADYGSGNGSSSQSVTVRCKGHHRMGELVVPSSFYVGEADWMLPPPQNGVENSLLIRNNGDAQMSVTATIINDAGGVFSLPNGGNVGNINDGSQGSLTIRADVSAETDYTGSLRLDADYGDGFNNSETVTLSAKGHHPSPFLDLVTNEINYHEVETGYAFRQEIKIKNSGDAPLNFQIRLQDDTDPDRSEFTLDLGQKTISNSDDPSENTMFYEMTFHPTSNGFKEIFLVIDNTNELNPTSRIVRLHGSGTDPVPLSTMLVIDRSGSMDGHAGEARKIEAARDACILYTELLRTPWDWLGITKYNDESSTPIHLNTIANNFNEAQSLLNDISTSGQLEPEGSTCIGCGMKTGAQEFNSSPPNNKQAMIILTDGKENEEPKIEDVKPGIKSTFENLHIYCVGIGDPIETGDYGLEGVESAKLEKIADEFDGIYRVIQELSGEHRYDLEAFYFKVFSRARGNQVVHDPTYRVYPSNQVFEIAQVNIAECDREVDFLIISEKYDDLIQLQDPTGQIIDPSSTIGGVGVHIKEWGDSRLIRIKFPPRSESDSYSGIWKLLHQPVQESNISNNVDTNSVSTATDVGGIVVVTDLFSGVSTATDVGGIVVVPDWFRVAFLAAVGSDYRMKASLTEGRISINQPIHLGVELTEAWWPAPNGAISVVITRPDGSVINGNLFDDGLHGDGDVGDAQFGLYFVETHQIGYYEFLFRGTGQTERGETVVREELLAKYIVGSQIPQIRPLHASFHVGATYPLGNLDSLMDSNIHLRADMTYLLNDRFQLVAMFGLNQFTAECDANIKHSRWINLSINLKSLFPTPSGTGLLLYLQGGPGYYLPKTGSNELGFNLGAGAQIPMGGPFGIEFGTDYHYISTDKQRSNFLTFQLGVFYR